MNNKSVDIGVGLGLCILSVWVFWYAGNYAGKGVNAYGPDFFPKVLSVIMFLCSSLLIFRAVAGFSVSALETTDSRGFVRAAISLVLAIIYLFFMKLVGFFIATVIFLYALMALLGQSGQITRILVSLIVPTLIYAAFIFFFKIPLPEGVVFDSFRKF